jgi:phosphate/sulfate permease
VALVSIRLAATAVGVTALVLVTVWLTDLSMERAVLLAPVLVVGVAAVAGLFVFWGRVGWESFRMSQRRRLIAALALAFVAVLVVLTLLGVDLPREGG